MAIPPASSTPAPAPPPVQLANAGTILQLPPSLNAAQSGQLLDGVVAERLANALVLVQTSRGDLILRSSIPLALNAAVTLRITSGGPQPNVTILQQGQPALTGPTAAVTMPVQTAPSGPGGGVDTVVTVPRSSSVGAVVTATVARGGAMAGTPTAPGSGGAVSSPTIPSGGITAIAPTAPRGGGTAIAPTAPRGGGTVIAPSVPRAGGGVSGAVTVPPISAGTAGAAAVPSGGGAVGTGAAPAAGPTGIASGPALNLAPGAQLPVRILAITPPATAIAAEATTAAAPTGARAAGPVFTATVTGANDAGQTVIRAGGIELTLATSRPLPVGGNLLLEALPLPPPPAGGLDPQSLALARRWEALHDALRPDNLSGSRAVLTNSIPRPGVQLAGTLLFFLSALRAGDLRGWLGQDAARLLAGAGSLDRLGEDFAVMQRLATEPAGQDWRLFLVPFLSDEQLHQMRFFIRDDSGDAGENASAGIRFIIEVTFTKLGPFQFDGLVRDKAMDLIVRTVLEVPRTARRNITQIYGDTLAALGYTGGVAIRTESFFDVQPLQEAGLPGKPGVFA